MDSLGTIATMNFAMTINALPLRITTTSPMPAGIVGVNYSRNIFATGGLTPYTWSLTGGALPDGLTFSSAGVLSGRPTTPGSFSFTVQVTDSVGTAISKGFLLNIN
ncbi:putative Ig domain-containing protein [Candidatus Desantisbacteria bacterium]|nr:putative Ig domain-containing protein [Candidatus Desantisbacteria bacterium]